MITNQGTVTWGHPSSTLFAYGYGSAQIYNYGLWVADYYSSLANSDNNTNKLFFNAGTFRKTSSGTATINWPFTTSGTIDQQGGGLSMSDRFIQTAGHTQLRGGNLSSSQPFQLLGGLLTGTNTFSGTITNSGTVSPGLPLGQLSVSGSYVQTPTGVLKIELAGTTQGSTYDWLSVSGNAQVAGKVVINLANSFVPPTNSTFTFLTSGTRTGNFGIVSYPTNLTAMQVNYPANSVVAQVTNILASVTPTNPVPATVANGQFSASFTGVPGATYAIEYSDTLSPANWQLLTTVVVPTSGVFSLSESVTISPSRYYRAYYSGY